MKARVYVTLKPSVFDPQGRVVADALVTLGYPDVTDVRQGKFFEVELADADITNVLPAAEIEKAFDLKEQLRNVDAVFKRVFYLSA